jgi:hypothetical protein
MGFSILYGGCTYLLVPTVCLVILAEHLRPQRSGNRPDHHLRLRKHSSVSECSESGALLTHSTRKSLVVDSSLVSLAHTRGSRHHLVWAESQRGHRWNIRRRLAPRRQ